MATAPRPDGSSCAWPRPWNNPWTPCSSPCWRRRGVETPAARSSSRTRASAPRRPDMPLVHALSSASRDGRVLCGLTVTVVKASVRPEAVTCLQCQRVLARLRPHAQPEAALAQQVRRLAARYGWLCYSVPDSRGATSNGFPDMVLVSPTRDVVLCLELKTRT